jgi:hypothetical protein
MTKIYLDKDVIVSDPCYELPTWCQAKLDNVLPGYYQPMCKIVDKDMWGRRNSLLMVIHEDYQFKDLTWTKTDHIIGVDSAQAGIFSASTYRNDEHSLTQYKPEGSWNYGNFRSEPGIDFYDLMCGITINNTDGWGRYDGGVVSSSGYGDGSYDLYVSYNETGEVVGICIDFLVEYEDDESLEPDFTFYMDSLG